MIAAPSAAMSAPAAAAAAIGELAAVREAVGRDVDDAHHLRLVEADGALAELQRRPRGGQRLPLRGHVLVEALFDALDRHQLGRARRWPSILSSSTAANQFSPPASRATLPSWPKGESTKAVGRRRVRMRSRYSAARCCCRKASSGFERAALVDVPEGPAVARRRALQRRADLVDRARMRARKRSSRRRGPSRSSGAWRRSASLPGGTSPLSTSTPNATRGCVALVGAPSASRFRRAAGSSAIRSRATFDVGRLALDADPAAAKPPRDRAGRAGAEERVEHHVAGLRAGEQDPVQQRLGLLRRVRLGAVVALDPLPPAADRQQPVGPHLKIVVQAPSSRGN